MAQIRIVLNERCLPLAEELIEVTGLENYSAVITVLFTRYGKHLKESWSLPNCPLAATENSAIAVKSAPEPFTPIEF